jgi:hypothetical protein
MDAIKVPDTPAMSSAESAMNLVDCWTGRSAGLAPKSSPYQVLFHRVLRRGIILSQRKIASLLYGRHSAVSRVLQCTTCSAKILTLAPLSS